MESPFLRPDSNDYADILTDATVHVLGGRGIDRFSIRAIARWMRVVPSTVLGEFSRARVLELVCICWEDRWLQWSASESMWGTAPASVPLRLPADEDEKLGVRVHHALLQLAEAEELRGNGALQAHLERLHQEEVALLMLRMRSRCCGAEPSLAAAHAVLAFATGLRLLLAHHILAAGHPDAVDQLAGFVTDVAAHTAECGAARLAS